MIDYDLTGYKRDDRFVRLIEFQTIALSAILAEPLDKRK